MESQRLNVSKIRKFVWEKSLRLNYTLLGYFKNENSLPTVVSVRYVLWSEERESERRVSRRKMMLISWLDLWWCSYVGSWGEVRVDSIPHSQNITLHIDLFTSCYIWRRTIIISIKIYMRFLFLRFSDHIFYSSCELTSSK